VRDVILPQNVIDNLPKYNNPNTYIFFPHGLPKEKAFQKAIDDFRAEAGIKCTLHQLRHSYATMLHSAGVDAKDAQSLLGHSSILVTQDIYTEVDKDAKEAARKKIEDYARKRGVLSKVLSNPANPHES
jgi:integrase